MAQENIVVLAQYRSRLVGMHAEIEALEQALAPSAPTRVPPAGRLVIQHDMS